MYECIRAVFVSFVRNIPMRNVQMTRDCDCEIWPAPPRSISTTHTINHRPPVRPPLSTLCLHRRSTCSRLQLGWCRPTTPPGAPPSPIRRAAAPSSRRAPTATVARDGSASGRPRASATFGRRSHRSGRTAARSTATARSTRCCPASAAPHRPGPRRRRRWLLAVSSTVSG